MSEQKKHSLMMVKNKRPMEQAEGIAVRLVDVLPVIAKEQLKALAQIVRLGDYSLNVRNRCCACRHGMLVEFGSPDGNRTRNLHLERVTS